MIETYKKLIFTSLILVLCFNLNGQIELKPLFEEFTSSTCIPCKAVNEVLDPIFHDNEATHSSIKYQVDWPASGDPYYIPETSTRIQYYVLSSAPSLYANGALVNAPINFNQSSYDSYLPEMTFMEIDITSAEIDANNLVNISVDLTALAAYAEGLKAHIVVVEKKTVNNARNNGETEFFNVLMQMLTGAEGATLPAFATNQTISLTESYDMNTTFMETANDLAVVVFVQDDSDKSVIQSENKDIEGQFETYEITFDVKDSDGNAVDGAEIFLESHGHELTNAAGLYTYTDILTSDLDYKVSFPGLINVESDLSLVDQDITIMIEMEIPEIFVEDDFNVEPSGWTSYSTGNDFVVWLDYDEKYTFFRISETLEPLYLVSPPYDLESNNGGTVIFNMGGINNNPEAGFGIITDPSDPNTMNEISSFFPTVTYQDYVFDLSNLANISNETRLYWNHKTSASTWFKMDYIIILEGQETTAIEEEYLKEVKVFPNPTSDFVNIHMDLLIEEIAIYDSSGRLVERKNVQAHDYELDTSRYHSGMYSLVIQSSKAQVTKWIVVKN